MKAVKGLTERKIKVSLNLFLSFQKQAVLIYFCVDIVSDLVKGVNGDIFE